MSQLTHPSIDWSDPGAPISVEFDDVYYSTTNGVAETEYVFLRPNGLPQRWLSHPRGHFAVAETGFGTGLNLLVLWHQLRQFAQRSDSGNSLRLHFVSFEKYPLTVTDLARSHRQWPQFADLAQQLRNAYPIATQGCHRLVLDQGRVTVDLWFGDALDTLPQVDAGPNGVFDAWFLDGFTPSKNPQMWQPELYQQMARLSRPDATYATFTSAGHVRRGLEAVGFSVNKLPGYGLKREMIHGQLPGEASPMSQPSHVAVVGAGVAGASTALALCRRGIAVNLYCQDPKPAQGASGNRQGALYPLLNASDDGLARFYSQAFPLARQQLLQLAECRQVDHALCGVVQLPVDDKSSNKLKKVSEAGFPLELVHAVDAEQATQIADLPLDRGGVYYPLGGWLCPAQLTQAMLDEAEATGLLTLQPEHRLTQLQRNDSGWQLQFEQQRSVQAESVVLATGVGTTALEATAALPLNPVRGQIAYPSAQGELASLKSVICADGYLVPSQDGRVTCGASFGRGDADDSIKAEDYQEIGQRMARSFAGLPWLPALAPEHYDQGRAAVRATVRDHLPLVGPVPQWDHGDSLPVAHQPGLHLLTGLGSRGLCSAALCAELLASQLCDEPRPLSLSDQANLAPDRFERRARAKAQKR
ncbi:bifunctional tRNA (5-methylaminomethyl-2-thiouridine)(34)-methyltransferase MnmD/FAD-dependent 5-carboxymethylaminomethyl-2-thiouridine(34) oxidoreductase MnmC [Ferrimonas marina]|uniref:tRNA 5-methylaminomethyl-2-thiouridine biosynthesis bifunctional protein MnmC n=1 Tax=Ferrimonas marina TaxID=299255 RepID=A0A1M5YA41_9GAMM|nr:bifunctional tRNA (5-methylaminomethyl-2-thiouridine)(34)-methyltransferase MnmD/FAD-dependent 5-carboxymethylaminomethyl-2-thiouridine(34) oxidoreductase MnmC [Ferrimonas marina]SHI08698.1 tRNA 5-methylaminomethyl-2-thiouridine biosynthesis bifunctional protein [Ferrimonas marina]